MNYWQLVWIFCCRPGGRRSPKNGFSLRAKVKSDTAHGGQSFFGINTLVNFDWRISTNGVELSEEEFRQLVEQKSQTD
ncbi:hypothetical protein GCM10020331_025660 [Ectobacillus funiculus]